MLCSSCNKEVDNSMLFCPYCGSRMGTESKTEDNSENEGDDVNDSGSDSEEKSEDNNEELIIDDISYDGAKKKKGKKILIIFLIIFILSVIIGACMVLYFLNYKNQSNKPKEYSTINQNAYFDENGNAYFASADGFVKISGSYVWGKTTKKQNEFVCLDDDGDLVYYPNYKDEKIKIADDVNGVEAISDYGVIYSTTIKKEDITMADILNAFVEEYNSYQSDEADKTTYDEVMLVFNYDNYSYGVNGAKKFYKDYLYEEFPEDYYDTYRYYKYTFDTKALVELDDADYVFLPSDSNSISCVGITENNKLIGYHENDTTSIELCTLEDGAQVMNYVPDLSSVFWSVENEDDRIIYATINGEKEKIGSLGKSSASYYKTADTYFLNGFQNYVIYGWSYDNIIVGSVGNTGYVVKIAEDKSIDGVYTDSGDNIYTYYNPENVDSILVLIDNDDVTNLYQINMFGEKEKIISKIKKVCDSIDNKIIYIDSDDSLYIATLENMKTSDEIRIAGDVYDAIVSKNNKYIYYSKDSGDLYDIYYVDLNAKELSGEKISSDVAKYELTEKDNMIFYIKDAEEIKDSLYYKAGTLYSYVIGEEPTKICSDITEFINVYEDDYVLSNSAVVLKYVDTFKDNEDDKYTNVIYDGGIIVDNEFEKQATEIGY